MSLENWVKLPVGKVVCMRFTDYRVATRQITDPYFGTPRMVEGLVFRVNMVDGKPVDKSYSVTSEKLADELKPYLEDGSFRDYEWCLVKDAAGFVPPRIARHRPI